MTLSVPVAQFDADQLRRSIFGPNGAPHSYRLPSQSPGGNYEDQSAHETTALLKRAVQEEPIFVRLNGNMSYEQQNLSVVETTPKTSKEIIARVRKLRWAGMDAEAERLLKELETRSAEDAAEGVLPTRVETD
jgi:hypothetical protein